MSEISPTTTSNRGGNAEIIEIIEEHEEDLITSSRLPHQYATNNNIARTAISEGGNVYNTTSLFSIDINNSRTKNRSSSEGDVVYVAVGKSPSSMDALSWALDHTVVPATTLLYLVHIFSEIKFIPNPLGKGWVPKSQVSRQLVHSYAAQESTKRRDLLAKYVDYCTAHQVQVETILIESDSVGTALLELISVLNIPKLILGISNSNLRKLRAGKWNGSTIADQLLQGAPVECQLNIICQGKDVSAELANQSPATPHTPRTNAKSPTSGNPQLQSPGSINNTSLACCFGGNNTVDD